MKVKVPIKNKRELSARMLEAALNRDRNKVMADGRPLHEHDIWRLVNTIVGSIRNNKHSSIGAQSYYRFKPYEHEAVPGLHAAQIACSSDYEKMSGRDYSKIGSLAEAALPIEDALQVMLDTWMQERGQWVMASYEGMSREQKEAVRACLDAREVAAAIRMFVAISNTGLDPEACKIFVDYTDDVLASRAILSLFTASAPSWTGRVGRGPNMQNIPFKKGK